MRNFNHIEVLALLTLNVYNEIVQLKNMYTRKDFVYLVFPFLGNKDLFDLFDKADEGIPIFQVRQLVLDMAKCIQICHLNNIVHCDIKMENFILTDNQLKLIDFGHSRYIDDGVRYANIPSGSVNYRAPELRNRQFYGTKSDVYSLGQVYALLLNKSDAPNSAQDRGLIQWMTEEQYGMRANLDEVLFKINLFE